MCKQCCNAEDERNAPAEDGVGEKSFEMLKDDFELHPLEPSQHVEAEDSHPAEHGEVGVETEVAKCGAIWMRKVGHHLHVFLVFLLMKVEVVDNKFHVFMVFLLMVVEVVDNKEVGGCQNGGYRAADEDLAMQVVEVGDPPVDKDGGEQTDDADRAKPGVNLLCYLVTICCVHLLLDLVENSLAVRKDASETEAGEN